MDARRRYGGEGSSRKRGDKGKKPTQQEEKPIDLPDDILNYPVVDWRKSDIMKSPVLDQDESESCWACAIVHGVEAVYNKSLTDGEPVQLAAQYLINLKLDEKAKDKKKDKKKNKKLISIPRVDVAYNWIIENGLCKEMDRPFMSNMSRKEKNRKPMEAIYIKSYKNIEPVNETHLLRLLVNHPVVGIIYVCNDFATLTKDEIYVGPKMSTLGRHAVLIIGYGTDENGIHFWLVNNSYGTAWGDRGYGKIIRSCSNDNRPSLFASISYPEF